MGKKSREKKERREQNLKLSNEKMTPFEQCEKFNVDWRDMKERFKNSEVHKKLTDEDWQKEAERLNSDTVFLNNLYQVNIHDDGSPMLHVSIKRRDKEACHDWRHFQQIKNELIGPTHEAVEIYPSEERLVDGANQYHLWVHKDPDFRWPFGFDERMVTEASEGDGTKQRPFE